MTWRHDDVIAGLMFLAIAALFGITAFFSLEIGTAGQMGPGYFPVFMSAILALLGLVIIARARGGEAVAHLPIPWRGLFFVLSAPVAFGLTVRTLGLVPALLFTVTLAVLASRRISWAKGLSIVVAMTIFCVAVFSYGIGLTVELFSSQLLP